MTTRNNLANWTGEAGDPAQARNRFAALLPDAGRVLGPDHPDTLNTRKNFAYWPAALSERAEVVGVTGEAGELVHTLLAALRADHS